MCDIAPKLPRANTQRFIILDILIKAQGSTVGLNRLMMASCCGAVHSQVDALRRKYGADIENTMKQKEGRKLSSYYLRNWRDFTQEA